MTVLALTKLWINLLSTGEGVSGASNSGKSQTFQVEGNIVKGASGRLRAVTVAGETGEFGYEFVLVDLATVIKLRGWLGQAVEVRDVRGQKRYGIFLGLNVTEYKTHTLYRIGFTLQALTVTEGV